MLYMAILYYTILTMYFNTNMSQLHEGTPLTHCSVQDSVLQDLHLYKTAVSLYMQSPTAIDFTV